METSIVLQQLNKKIIEIIRNTGIGNRLIKFITILFLLFGTTLMSSCFFRGEGWHHRHEGHDHFEHHDDHHDDHR